VKSFGAVFAIALTAANVLIATAMPRMPMTGSA
jgi:hypothetical protein